MATKDPRNYRDAGSGRYVPKENERKQPGKTVSEPRTPPPPKKK